MNISINELAQRARSFVKFPSLWPALVNPAKHNQGRQLTGENVTIIYRESWQLENAKYKLYPVVDTDLNLVVVLDVTGVEVINGKHGETIQHRELFCTDGSSGNIEMSNGEMFKQWMKNHKILG